MTALSLPAPAKLNLFLHVTGRRHDGYHEIQTLFQFLDHADELTFVVSADPQLRIEGNAGVDPEADLILSAAQLLQEASGTRHGVSVRVRKRLPIGAGLGGGSSDAATTLVALNHLWKLGLNTDELSRVALQLGADVPVFVQGVAAWAEGIGERLQPVEDLPEPWYLVLDPAVSVSTAEVFSAAELTREGPKITIADFLSGRGKNHLQAVVEGKFPQVEQAFRWLSAFAPAAMTGSGSCLFAAFAERRQAQAVLEQIPPVWTGFVARGRNRSPLLDAMARLGNE